MSVLALPNGQQSAFARWQPVYAALGIPIFPVDMGADGRRKKPLPMGYLGTTPRSSEGHLARWPDAQAFGFVPGKVGITVLDIDTTDEVFLADQISKYGHPRVIVRTASGKWHGYYRNSGEDDHIRLFGRDVPVDIKGSAKGYIVAPGSLTPFGKYEVVHGSLEDLRHLTPLRAHTRPKVELAPPAPPQGANDDGPRLREGDGRNDALFRHCMEQAPHCDDADALIDVARAFADDRFRDAMTDGEISRTALSAWKCESSGNNLIGRASQEGQRVYVTGNEVHAIMAAGKPEAIGLLTCTRMSHWDRADFILADAMAGTEASGFMSRRTFKASRKLLEELGLIVKIRGHSSTVGPALYSWPKPK